MESSQHYLIYHLPHREIRVRGSMAQAEQQLSGLPFARCNVCYLVNLRRVTSLRQEEAVLGDVTLKMSRGYRKEFLNRFTAYIGGLE